MQWQSHMIIDRHQSDLFAAERQRIRSEYQRREREIAHDLYAPWQPSEIFLRGGRKRIAAKLLLQAGVFPKAGNRCLEVGFGSLGWLGDLITWGVREQDLHGIELDPVRAEHARKLLPVADLRVGDATELPWDKRMFHLAIASTLFTSILDQEVRRRLAEEIARVLLPGGAVLWYDFAVDNPRNPHVRSVGRRELKQLFPQLRGEIRSVSLAPPLARLVAPKSRALATILESIPFLRTHLLAVLVKAS
jgi:ubiquinone/menaquinone biosynthesis C-methylase UbiE